MKTFKQFIEEKTKHATGDLKKACWKGYAAIGTKEKNGRTVPNCVPEEVNNIEEKNAGLWANIHAKQNRIKNGSGEHMRKPNSKGAPSDSDFRSINAAAKKESTEKAELNQQFDIIEAMIESFAEYHNVDSEFIWEDIESVDDEELLDEVAAWQRKAGKNPEGGLNKKGIASYRRENPGSKLSMAVTTPPSKLNPDSKAAKRRKSFCARMGGMQGAMKKPNGEPTRKALSLKKWNC